MQSATLYELDRVNVDGPLGLALAPLDLRVRDHAVTALVGPVGSGKSTLLRLLSGRALSDGWVVDGRWLFRGHAVDRGAPLKDVAWLPQIRNAPINEHVDRRACDVARARLDGAFFCGASVVLLDEPARSLPRHDWDLLVSRLREHRQRGAAVVISHDLAFVRAIADDVCLLMDGALVTHSSASNFFNRSENDLVRQYIRYGTCAQDPVSPTLPRHFRWHEAGRMAGMGRPGLMRDIDDDLFSIAHAGVSLLVSLTEEPISTARLRPFGIAGRHFPIRDMGIPSLGEALSLCHDLIRSMDRGQVVALHCHAGLGRTGTILAATAVCRGMSAAQAIEQVREVAPGSIQTERQADFVRRLEALR